MKEEGTPDGKRWRGQVRCENPRGTIFKGRRFFFLFGMGKRGKRMGDARWKSREEKRDEVERKGALNFYSEKEGRDI